MSECLAVEAPASAEDYAETAMRILERMETRADFAKAMVTRAALRQRTGDIASARRLLDEASAIFHTLGCSIEPAQVRAAFAALERGSPIRLLADGS